MPPATVTDRTNPQLQSRHSPHQACHALRTARQIPSLDRRTRQRPAPRPARTPSPLFRRTPFPIDNTVCIYHVIKDLRCFLAIEDGRTWHCSGRSRSDRRRTHAGCREGIQARSPCNDSRFAHHRSAAILVPLRLTVERCHLPDRVRPYWPGRRGL